MDAVNLADAIEEALELLKYGLNPKSVLLAALRNYKANE